MLAVARQVPDVEALLELDAAELGMMVLQAYVASGERYLNRFFLGNESVDGHAPVYDRAHRVQVVKAFGEAISWLISNGLLMPEEGTNGQSGFHIATRQAEKVLAEGLTAFQFQRARALPRAHLQSSIRDRVWRSFMRGEYDAAVLEVMKRVEIAVREACGWGRDKHGVPMIAEAFHVENGPLTDLTAQVAEREARRNLFTGTYGAYRNPHAHHDVDLDDPEEALEIILLGNHLLRIVDTRKSANEAGA